MLVKAMHVFIGRLTYYFSTVNYISRLAKATTVEKHGAFFVSKAFLGEVAGVAEHALNLSRCMSSRSLN